MTSSMLPMPKDSPSANTGTRGEKFVRPLNRTSPCFWERTLISRDSLPTVNGWASEWKRKSISRVGMKQKTYIARIEDESANLRPIQLGDRDAAVDIAPVGNAHDEHKKNFASNLIENPIIAHAQSVQLLLTLDFLDAVRIRILR